MTETGRDVVGEMSLTAVEALCEEIASLQAERDALLAVVEAAQDVNDAGVETEGGWFVDLDALLRLRHRIEALHSQASDEDAP